MITYELALAVYDCDWRKAWDILDKDYSWQVKKARDKAFEGDGPVKFDTVPIDHEAQARLAAYMVKEEAKVHPALVVNGNGRRIR